ncbi:YbjQ family protein [Euzebya tangerina]|uniref:YbjQ family protein n=1 Tax=Euzebya tangerina TaxID=591198 RepID=UPI000E310915|nr:YbjQ family protein [Euzebya tangerina]
MILVNTETIPGQQIVALRGLVQGNTIRAKNIGRDIGAGLKNLVGGELTAYTELMTEARDEAVSRMVAQAQQLGANAIVNVRFTTSQVAGGAAELYAYGTAVTVQPTGGAPQQADAQGQFGSTPQQAHPQGWNASA